MRRPRPYYRTKIKLNVWRDPMPILKSEDYASPHCSSGACAWCTERRARKARQAAAAREAAAAPSMFWESKIFPGTKWDLGPSAPDAWKKTYVREI